MDARGLLLAQHASVHSAPVSGGRFADEILSGLSDGQMRVRPGKTLNSLAWLLWHMARTEDVGVNVIATDSRQVLDRDWAEQLGIARRDIGTAMTDDEVDALTRRLDVGAARAYRDAVGRRTREVLAALPPEAWATMVTAADIARAKAAGALGPNTGCLEKVWLTQTRAMRLSITAVTHNFTHLGEAQAVRGLAGFGGGR